MNVFVRWAARYALARARESSTWRGLILLAGGSWAVAHPAQAEALISVCLALVGLIGSFFPDAGDARDAPQVSVDSTPPAAGPPARPSDDASDALDAERDPLPVVAGAGGDRRPVDRGMYHRPVAVPSRREPEIVPDSDRPGWNG